MSLSKSLVKHFENESPTAFAAKVTAMGAGTFLGMTLTEWAALATLIYTVLNIFFLLRDRWRRRNDFLNTDNMGSEK